MKFKIDQAEFARAFLICNKAISTKATLPVLSNILLKSSGNDLELLSTDLESAIRVKMICRGEGEGAATLPGRMALEFISGLPSAEIVFEKLGEEALISTKGYSARFSTVKSEDFPAIPHVDNGVEIKVKAQDFSDAASKVAFSAALDEARPILTGVFVEVSKDKLMMVATDGYRLSFCEIKSTFAGPTIKLVIPARAIDEVAKIITELNFIEDVIITISTNQSQVSFKVGSVEFSSRLIEGAYPDWKKFIPTAFSSKIKIKKEEFIKSVKMASIFARDSGNIIRLNFSAGEGKVSVLKISANTHQVGGGEVFCDVGMEGKGGEIAFNFRYLLEALSIFTEENVNFEIIESLNPGKMTSGEKEEKFFHIIMPVRLQS